MTLTAIRDTAAALITATGAFVHVEASRILPNGLDQMPAARLFLRKESGKAHGSANHGAPAFQRAGTLTIATYLPTGGARDGDAASDAAIATILTTLFETRMFLDLVESVDAVRTEYEVLDQGESYVIEATTEIDLTIGAILYEPAYPADDFAGMNVGGLPTDPLTVDPPL